jgi:hypothetical protein
MQLPIVDSVSGPATKTFPITFIRQAIASPFERERVRVRVL